MATLAVRCSGNAAATACISKSRFRNQVSLSISNSAVKKPRPLKVSASSMALTPNSVSSSFDNNLIPFDKILNQEFNNDIESRVSEKLDEWMRDSVGDIVKNLKQAPLLVQVYANNNGSTKVKTERAVAENWPNVVREKPSPDGIILVEELGKNDLDLGMGMGEEAGEGTKAWGVLIQGKGGERECGSACYLLKTSRVGGGLGLFCTHFCLVKVKSFRDTSALQQLSDSWLLQ